MTSLDFLKLVWPQKPQTHYLLIWSRDDKQSHWFRDIAGAAKFVQGAHGRDVYVGVGVAGREYGPKLRCPSAEIAGIAGLWADFDLKSNAHDKNSLPTTIAEALTIVPKCFAPSIVVSTGNGVHVWWLFKEPWIFENNDERNRAADLSSQFHTLLRYRSTQFGWTYERLGDLARVLRIAGTVNAKDPADPKNITVFSTCDQRYNPSDFEGYLDDLSIADGEAGVGQPTNWVERFKDTPLTFDLCARIPEETLNHWMKEDVRFRNTWFRQRNDLNDQSQSGYDMALASFGVKRGLPAQPIVDLIVHHRAMHKRQPRTSLDYYQRTLSKAMNAANPRPTPPGVPDQPLSGPVSICSHADPTIAKAQLCEQLSSLLGIKLLRIVKITGKQPVYRMELENGKIEFPNVGKLLNQQSLRMAIAAETNYYIQKRAAKVWEQTAQLMLNALTEQDGGEEMQLEGSARMHVERYLSDSGSLLPTVEGLKGQSAHRPMIYKGEIAVCSTDMLMYLNKSMSQSLTLPSVTAMLSAVGGQTVRVRGKFPEQGRWALPIEKFDPVEYGGQGDDYEGQGNE